MTVETIEVDLMIVGAGPGGLFAAFEAGMLNIPSIHILESLDEVGGQCQALYPDKFIYDMPGIPKVSGRELVQGFYEQMSQFPNVTLHLRETVQAMENLEDGRLKLTTSAQRVFHCRAVIIATGAGSFAPNKPELDSLESLEGTQVFYRVTDVEIFRHRKVLVAGGGDAAVDWALNLLEVADEVTLVHRRAEFRCSPANAAKLAELAQQQQLKMLTPYALQSLDLVDGQLQGVKLSHLQNQSETTVECDRLLILFGLATSAGNLLNWGLELDKNRILVDPLTMVTNRPNVFAIGDIVTYPGKIKLVHMTCAEATRATRAAYQSIFPEAKLTEVHSSTAMGKNS